MGDFFSQATPSPNIHLPTFDRKLAGFRQEGKYAHD
jgi:hypothetical protein